MQSKIHQSSKSILIQKFVHTLCCYSTSPSLFFQELNWLFTSLLHGGNIHEVNRHFVFIHVLANIPPLAIHMLYPLVFSYNIVSREFWCSNSFFIDKKKHKISTAMKKEIHTQLNSHFPHSTCHYKLLPKATLLLPK